MPPIAQLAATGIRVSPIVVMTTPVTTGGKNRMIWAKNGVMRNPTADATMTAPRTAGMPPPPPTMATIVDTPANETPCTRGSWEPKSLMPTVCRIVASPPMNREAATRVPISAAVSPAAPPTISGGAMIPPYIVSTCWKPYPKVAPSRRRSSSGRAGVVAARLSDLAIADLLVR